MVDLRHECSRNLIDENLTVPISIMLGISGKSGIGLRNGGCDRTIEHFVAM